MGRRLDGIKASSVTTGNGVDQMGGGGMGERGHTGVLEKGYHVPPTRSRSWVKLV